MSNCLPCNNATPYQYSLSPVEQINMSTYYNAPVNTYWGGCDTNTTNNSWIDEYLRTNFKYGYKVVNEDTGDTQLSLIQSWLINWDTIQTPVNSRGYKMGSTFTSPGSDGNWQQYIKVVGDKAFQYKRNELTGVEMIGGDWLFSIPNDYIRSVSGAKIIEPHKLFAKVATPITNYLDPLTGQLNAGNIAIPIVYSVTNNGTGDITQLKAIITPSSLNSNIVSQLTTPKGLLWNSNPLQNTVTGFNPQNLDNLANVSIDGTTIRAVITGQLTTASGTQSGGAGDRTGGTYLKSYTYTDGVTLEGEGTTASPIKVKPRSITAGYFVPLIKRLNSQYPLTPSAGNGNAIDGYALNTVLWTTFGDMDIPFADFGIRARGELLIGNFDVPGPYNFYGKYHLQIADNINFNNPIAIPIVGSNDDWTGTIAKGNDSISRQWLYFSTNNPAAGKYYFRLGISFLTNVNRRIYLGEGNSMIIEAFAQA